MKKEIISLENVTFTYSEEESNILPAINDVSFSIKEGEWVVEYIYEVDEKHTKKLMQRLQRYNGDPKGIIELKNNIKK